MSARVLYLTPAKTIGLVLIVILIGIGFGYSISSISQTVVKTTTVTKSVRVGEPVTTTITKTTSAPLYTIPTNATGNWTSIYKFKGVGSKTSEDFKVPVGYWRLKYTVEAEDEKYAHFSIFVYPAGEMDFYTEYITFDNSGHDYSYIRGEVGYYYIKVNAANLRSWQIRVDIQE